MTLALDLPTGPLSFLHRLDPRWKLAALVLAALLVVCLRAWPACLAALLLALLLVRLARLPTRWVVARLAAALLLTTLFMLWLPFVPRPGDDLLDLGSITLSATGLGQLVALLARVAALVALMLVLLATAPLPETFHAAHALHAPGLLVQLTLLTYRYLFLLAEEFDRLRLALRVRGFRNRPDLHSYRTIGLVVGMLLVRSHERAERLSQAMRCRGFDGIFRSLRDERTRPADVGFFLAVVVSFALIAGGDWYYR